MNYSVNDLIGMARALSKGEFEARSSFNESDHGLSGERVIKPREIGEKHSQEPLALRGYLSFQDVLRQWLEKVQRILGQVEDKTLELIVKCKVKANEKSIKDGGGANFITDADLDQNLVDQLMVTLR